MDWIKKHKVLTAIGVFLLLIVLAGAGGSSNQQNTSTSTKDSTKEQKKEEAPKEISLNQPARDGKFEFVVKGIKCGQPTVGAEFMSKTAQGQYCLLDVAVKNVGNEAQSLFSSNQFLYNASGQKFSADDSATYSAAPNGSSWYSQINPGNSVEGQIVFDIPKDQTPVSAELHDSAFSTGVKVKLQ